MVMVPLRNIGAGGLVPDQQPYDVELTQFAAGNNVQFTSGRIGKALGHTAVTALAFQPTHVAAWVVDGNDSVVLGSNNRLYRYAGSTVAEVTAAPYTAAGYSNSPRWQTAQTGTNFIANNGADIPQYMTPTGTAFANLPNWPTALRTTSLRPYQSFLVMAGYENGSSDYPYTVRWSDEFDPTGVPGSYDITSTTNLAGENVLGGRYGKLVDALPLGGNNIIYAERGAYSMTFIGAPLVFGFRELFDDGGLINLGAVCVFENQHFVVGRDDIYVHDGSAKKSIVDKRIKEFFFGLLADTRSVFVMADPVRTEIWVGFADKNATDKQTANRAIVWNWVNNAWTIRDLPHVRQLAVGPNIGGGGTGESITAAWDGLEVAWDNWSASWTELGADTEARGTRIFGAGHTGSALYAHNETFGANGTAYTAFLESSKIDMDAVLQRPTERILHITRIIPQINGVGQVTFHVGSSNSPMGPVTWKTEKVFNVETDYKVDTRVSGRYLALRVESANTDGYWQLSGFDIDVSEVSER